MTDNFDDLVDIVRNDPQGLVEVEEPLIATAVLKQLILEGMAPAKVLERIIHSCFCDRLFRFITSHYRKSSDWEAFEDAILISPAEWWETLREMNHHTVFEYDLLVYFFDKVTDLDKLIKRNRDRFLSEKLPFVDVPNRNVYWIERLEWYLAKEDFERAWKELKRAHRGIHVSDSYTPLQLLRGEAKYAFEAGPRTVVALVEKLYNVLEQRGILSVKKDKNGDSYFRTAGLKIPESASRLVQTIENTCSMASRQTAMVVLMARYFDGLGKKKRRDKIRRKADKLGQ